MAWQEEAILNLRTEAMSIQELARYYLSQRSTVRAAALMIKLVKTEPTPETLADIYLEQGLFDDARFTASVAE